ncbi:MAG: toxin-antitoxin system HicB family antitoxin [Acetobacteraceae bacterium]|nr:toxin-antitoxin system HicB family antitoxin [Acetobacteraceae bacterium]
MDDHYTYRVSWSGEDQEFVATCVEFPSLSHLDASQGSALVGIRDLVRDVIADLRASGQLVPQPLAEQRFSGNFQTRVHADLHRQLAIEAAEAGMSLNRLVAFKLAQPVQRTIPAPIGRRRAMERAQTQRDRTEGTGFLAGGPAGEIRGGVKQPRDSRRPARR